MSWWYQDVRQNGFSHPNIEHLKQTILEKGITQIYINPNSMMATPTPTLPFLWVVGAGTIQRVYVVGEGGQETGSDLVEV